MIALICERFDAQDVIKAQEMAERDWALFSNSPGINKGREFFALLAAQYQKMALLREVEDQGVAAARRSKI